MEGDEEIYELSEVNAIEVVSMLENRIINQRKNRYSIRIFLVRIDKIEREAREKGLFG